MSLDFLIVFSQRQRKSYIFIFIFYYVRNITHILSILLSSTTINEFFVIVERFYFLIRRMPDPIEGNKNWTVQCINCVCHRYRCFYDNLHCCENIHKPLPCTMFLLILWKRFVCVFVLFCFFSTAFSIKLHFIRSLNKQRTREKEREVKQTKCKTIEFFFGSNVLNREIKFGMLENARRYKVTKRKIAL